MVQVRVRRRLTERILTMVEPGSPSRETWTPVLEGGHLQKRPAESRLRVSRSPCARVLLADQARAERLRPTSSRVVLGRRELSMIPLRQCLTQGSVSPLPLCQQRLPLSGQEAADLAARSRRWTNG